MKVNPDKCRGCKLCVRACKVRAIEMVNGVAHIGDKCVGCRVCVTVCPFEAIEADW